MRQSLLTQRRSLTPARQHQAQQSAQAWLLSQLKGVEHIGFYMPMMFEINLHPTMIMLLEQACVYLPICEGTDLRFVPYTLETKMQPHAQLRHHEPVGQPMDPDRLQCVVVPSLAIDAQGHRLGYGGGRYDRTLSQMQAKRIGVSVHQGTWPIESHDIALDAWHWV